jgi:hypothetical protein
MQTGRTKMKKALIVAPAVAIIAACGGEGGDAGIAGDTLGIGTGTTTTAPGTYSDPAMGGTGTMGDTVGMGMGMGMDTMGMGVDTGMGTGTTRP